MYPQLKPPPPSADTPTKPRIARRATQKYGLTQPPPWATIAAVAASRQNAEKRETNGTTRLMTHAEPSPHAPPGDATSRIEALADHLIASGDIPFPNAKVDLSLNRAPGDREAVGDSPERAIICDAHGAPYGVLFLAVPVSPDLVGRGVRNAQAAREMLGAEAGAVILEPLVSGEFEGLSYVLWPWVRPVSSSRYVAYVQRRLLRRSVLAWLRDATERTKHADSDGATRANYEQALNNLSAIPELPAEMADEAKRGLERLHAGAWRPYHVLEHNDFWFGNIMLPSARGNGAGKTYPFHVIDWAGARTSGYPIFDLIRLARTTGLSGRALHREIQLHCAILECAPEDAAHYLLAALGYLEQTLEHFPRDRYIALCGRTFDTMTNALE